MERVIKTHLAEHGFLWGPEQNPYGISGLMTYGPAGKRVKSHIEAGFQAIFAEEQFDPIETPILTQTAVWEASGHVERFKDEMFHTSTSKGQPLTARSEIATTIYPMYKQLIGYYGALPFRVSQSGPVLPNDRQTEWQLRTRQYTAHEGHIFLEAGTFDVEEVVRSLAALAYRFMGAAGIEADTLRFGEKLGKDKPFYANRAFGLYSDMNDGKELEVLGIQYRSSWDMERHARKTGVKLYPADAKPEAFEISFSTDRPFYLLAERAFSVREGKPVMRFPVNLAPWKIAVATPKHQDREIAGKLLKRIPRQYHPMVISGRSVSDCHQRADALGVPRVLSVRKDGVISLRDRDTEVIENFDASTPIAEIAKESAA